MSVESDGLLDRLPVERVAKAIFDHHDHGLVHLIADKLGPGAVCVEHGSVRW